MFWSQSQSLSVPPFVVGGIVASPLIGLVIGRIYRPCYKLSRLRRILQAIFTLYLAAAIFALSMGLYGLSCGLPDWDSFTDVILMVWLTWIYLTFTGFVAFLWPLAYLNHLLLEPFGKPV
jgi:hypothetical protein